MISGASILVSLVRLVGSLPFPPPPARRKRGRPPTYADQRQSGGRPNYSPVVHDLGGLPVPRRSRRHATAWAAAGKRPVSHRCTPVGMSTVNHIPKARTIIPPTINHLRPQRLLSGPKNTCVTPHTTG